MGTIYAYDARSYGNWRRGRDRKEGRSRGLVGAALEAAVAAWRMQMPEYVVVGARP